MGNGPAPAFSSRKTPLAVAGGALGIAACLIGLASFLAACFGLQAALWFAPVPLGLSLVGLGLTIWGGVFQKHLHTEDTHVLAGVFLNALALAGASLEMAALFGWSVFSR